MKFSGKNANERRVLMPAQPRHLTERQRKILATIRTGIANHGFPPTVREIAQAVGLTSPSSVHYQLDTLEAAGLIQRNNRRSRAIEVTDLGMDIDVETGLAHMKPQKSAHIQHCHPGNHPGNITALPTATSDFSELSEGTVIAPLVGTIAAGMPILAQEDIETSFPLPKQLTGEGELFVLHVQGDSMIDAAICDGDYVVVRRQPVAENGEIVAAMIEGEATVKVLNKQNEHVWLMPRNEDYEPILGDHAAILGRVVCVLRSL